MYAHMYIFTFTYICKYICSTEKADGKHAKILNFQLFYILKNIWDFPGGAVVKNPRANAGDTGSSPGPGRSHMPWSK